MAKYGMSMCVLGMAEEFRGKVGVNALWPRTVISTAAIQMIGGDAMMKQGRKPEIMADAYSSIFNEIVRRSGDVFSQPVRLSSWRKLLFGVRLSLRKLRARYFA